MMMAYLTPGTLVFLEVKTFLTRWKSSLNVHTIYTCSSIYYVPGTIFKA